MAAVAKVRIEFRFPNYLKRLKVSRDRIERFVSAQIQTNRGMMFDTEGSYNGKPPWAPLKYRSGQILSLSGALRKSFAPPGDSGAPGPNGFVVVRGTLRSLIVQVGTNLAYAPMMNWGTTKLPGGVLRPVRAKALRFPIPGGGFAFAHSVKIPARRMDLWSKADEDELEAALANFVTRVLDGR